MLAFLLAMGNPTWCDSIAQVAEVTAQARAAGMSRADADAAVQRLPTADARYAGRTIVDVAYTVPAAAQMPPHEFADLVRQACTQQGD